MFLYRHNDGQMKSFFVGGPNQRKDYHIEEGEEVLGIAHGQNKCLTKLNNHRLMSIVVDLILYFPVNSRLLERFTVTVLHLN